jgi:putative FmdB family regulatory protein
VPIYAFRCADCGSFDLQRPMAEAGLPAPCPACGAPAERVFTPPGLALLPAPTRRALALEEKSAHEPEVVSAKRGRPMRHGHEPAPPWVLAH